MLTVGIVGLLLLTACGKKADKPEVAGEATAAATTTAVPTTEVAPLDTSVATATTEQPLSTVPADPRCAGPSAKSGDVDGDEVIDEVLHVFADGNPILRVCGSAAGYNEIPGMGMAQYLELVDVEQDGQMEIFYGATTAVSLGVQIAVVSGGVLERVTTGGSPVGLFEGYPQGQPPDGPRMAFGCRDLSGDGVRDLVSVEVTVTDPELVASTTGFGLNGASATVVQTTSASAVYPPDGDSLAMAADLAQQEAPSC